MVRMNGKTIGSITESGVAAASGIGRPIKRILRYSDPKAALEFPDIFRGQDYAEVHRGKGDEYKWKFKKGKDTIVVNTLESTISFEYQTVNRPENEELVNALLESYEGKITEVKQDG